MKKPAADLFDEPFSPAGAHPAPENTTALGRKVKVTAQNPGDKLSPAQQRFNKLLTRIENLTRQLQGLDVLLQKHHAPHQQALSALHLQADALKKAMILQLHSQLHSLKLSKAQRQDLMEIVESLLLQTEHLQDPELLALFDQYFSQEDIAVWKNEDAESDQMLRNLAEKLLDADDLQDMPNDPAALLHLLRQKLEASQQAQQASQATRRQNRRPTPRQQQAEQQQLDAKATLRSLFRQLASALHPDREQDPAERERKTALMSQANAAYERQDLATLLQLQLQTTVMDAQSIARLTDEKLATMSTLLKQQVSTLEAELRQTEARASVALNTPLSAKTSEATIERRLHAQRHQLQEAVDGMRADIEHIQDPVQLKHWLKIQAQLTRQQAAMDDWLDDFL